MSVYDRTVAGIPAHAALDKAQSHPGALPQWFFFALGMLLAFDNIPVLYSITGLYLASPALPLLALAVWRLWPRAVGVKATRTFLHACFMLTLWSLVNCVASIMTENAATLNLTKAVTTGVIVLTWLLTVVLGVLCADRDRVLLTNLGIGLVLASAAGLALQVTDVMPANSVDLFHAVNWHADRPRGFKYESSSFGASLIAGTTLVAMHSKRRLNLLVWACAALLILASSSRGALTAFVVGTAVGMILFLSVRSRLAEWAVAAAFSFIAIFLSFFGARLVQSDTWAVLKSGTGGSDGVRTGWGMVAWRVLTDGPFTLNVANYWENISQYIAAEIPAISRVYSRVQIGEFYAFLTSTSDSGLSPKSVPALFAVWFGWFGVLFAVGLLSLALIGLVRFAQSINSAVFLALGVASLVSLVMFVPGIFQYELAVVVGVGLSSLSFFERVRGGARSVAVTATNRRDDLNT